VRKGEKGERGRTFLSRGGREGESCVDATTGIDSSADCSSDVRRLWDGCGAGGNAGGEFLQSVGGEPIADHSDIRCDKLSGSEGEHLADVKIAEVEREGAWAERAALTIGGLVEELADSEQRRREGRRTDVSDSIVWAALSSFHAQAGDWLSLGDLRELRRR
jgi:hypothetical protein